LFSPNFVPIFCGRTSCGGMRIVVVRNEHIGPLYTVLAILLEFQSYPRIWRSSWLEKVCGGVGSFPKNITGWFVQIPSLVMKAGLPFVLPFLMRTLLVPPTDVELGEELLFNHWTRLISWGNEG